jgi:hypothetical protein
MPTQPPVRKVRFDIRPWGGEPDPARELLPYVDNVSLVDLVSGYEHASDFRVPGKYAGLVIDHFKFGDLTAYLMGEPQSDYWANRDVIALLGCDCGEIGCWPLEAQVIVDDSLVTWRGFAQPHRPTRDYGTFGPFAFRRNQYERAVRDVTDNASRFKEHRQAPYR